MTSSIQKKLRLVHLRKIDGIKRLDEKDREQIKEIVSRYSDIKGGIIEILHAVEREYKNYFPEEVLREIADLTGLPLSNIYSVATFYSLFSVKPRNSVIIRMCESPPCHVEGANEVLEAVQKKLDDIKPGENTKDGKFTLELTECLGLCSVAPAMMVNDDVYGRLTPEKAVKIIEQYM